MRKSLTDLLLMLFLAIVAAGSLLVPRNVDSLAADPFPDVDCVPITSEKGECLEHPFTECDPAACDAGLLEP